MGTPRLRVVGSMLLAFTLVVALVGCGSDTVSGVAQSLRPVRARVSGSGTCLPLLRIMMKRYPGQDIEPIFLPGLHSGGGIQGVVSDDLEIGAVSRDLTADERNLGLDYTLLSTDGLAIATHPSVSLDGLTTAQVRDIYRGKYVNWKQLGGPDLAITILDRNEDESAKIILRKYVLGKDLRITSRAVSLYYESDMVSGLKDTPGAIGYFSLGYGISERVAVNYLKLDGVEPSVENVENGSYKVVRPLGIVTRKDASGAVQRFLEWARSQSTQTMIEGEGYAPAAK